MMKMNESGKSLVIITVKKKYMNHKGFSVFDAAFFLFSDHDDDLRIMVLLKADRFRSPAANCFIYYKASLMKVPGSLLLYAADSFQFFLKMMYI